MTLMSHQKGPMQPIEQLIAFQNPDGRLPCIVTPRAGQPYQRHAPVMLLLQDYEGTGNGGETFAWQVEEMAQHELFALATKCLGVDVLPDDMAGELVCIKQTGRDLTTQWIMPRAGV